MRIYAGGALISVHFVSDLSEDDEELPNRERRLPEGY